MSDKGDLRVRLVQALDSCAEGNKGALERLASKATSHRAVCTTHVESCLRQAKANRGSAIGITEFLFVSSETWLAST